MQIRRPSMHLLAAASLAAPLPVTAQALDIGNQSTAHVRFAPGLHVLDTPQIFGRDSVLELVLSGGVGCVGCAVRVGFVGSLGGPYSETSAAQSSADSLSRWPIVTPATFGMMVGRPESLKAVAS